VNAAFVAMYQVAFARVPTNLKASYCAPTGGLPAITSAPSMVAAAVG
jgi:hypothetical protein